MSISEFLLTNLILIIEMYTLFHEALQRARGNGPLKIGLVYQCTDMCEVSSQ